MIDIETLKLVRANLEQSSFDEGDLGKPLCNERGEWLRPEITAGGVFVQLLDAEIERLS